MQPKIIKLKGLVKMSTLLNYKKILLLLLLVVSLQAKDDNNHVHGQIVKITPSEVFTEALIMEKELDILKEHFDVDISSQQIEKNTQRVDGNFKSKHVWQLGYMLNVKINVFREKNNLPRIEEVGREPTLNVNPNLPYGMLKRVNTEILIIKKAFGITKKITNVKKVKGKTSIDVFSKLLLISKELDKLNGQTITPSAVFAQVMRVYHDVTTILNTLNITDDTIPPQKNENSKPKDSFTGVQNFIKHLKKLQRMVDIERTDFSGLAKNTITPEDTFILVQMAAAEFQIIKANLGLIHNVTPAAEFYDKKTPSDVEQLIGWTTRRIKLIKDLEVR